MAAWLHKYERTSKLPSSLRKAPTSLNNFLSFYFRKVLSVEKLIIHQDYNQGVQYSNDIALMKLTEKLDLEVYMPACLIPRGRDLIDMTGYVYGWGRTDHMVMGISNILRETSLTIKPNNECKKLTLDKNMICGLNNNSTFCNGDSGGPMTVDMGGRHYLAGIISAVELVDGEKFCPNQVKQNKKRSVM